MRSLDVGLSVLPLKSPTLPPATHTNAWVLGEENVVVIDPASPWPDEKQRIATALQGRCVKHVILTHHHGDHIAGAEDLRDRFGASILAHPLTAEQIPFSVDGVLQEGDQLHLEGGTWTVLHTPGHAQGHLCLLREDGYTVAGDMVAGVGTILLQPPEGDLAAYLNSLQRLIDTGTHTLLPAHGPEISPAAPYLQHYIDHRHRRTRQIQAALESRAQPSTPADLVPLIYADVPKAVWPIAARQVLCHLQWLSAQQSVLSDGTAFWVQ